jgi:hypothetical protein
VISGSPTQMRAVLAQKLALDGVRVVRLILKDNLGNLRRGRLRAVRGQVGYKLPHLLEERRLVAPSTTETLFGDDAEVDGVIYATYAAVLAGAIGTDELVAVLRRGEAYDDAIERAVDAARALVRADAVEDIFIRLDRGLPTGIFRLLDTVSPVFSWFQAAVCLAARGRLATSAVAQVHAQSGLSIEGAANQVQDLARRSLRDRGSLLDALSAPEIAPLRARAERKLSSLDDRGDRPGTSVGRDFAGFFDALRHF